MPKRYSAARPARGEAGGKYPDPGPCKGPGKAALPVATSVSGVW